MRIALLSCLLASAMLPALAADTTPHYQLLHKFVLGGDGGWDYLTYDSVGGRLFIARSTRVQVVDGEKGTLLGEIPDTAGVHGVAFAQELGKGFSTDGMDNTVTVFDLKSLRVTAKIKIPGDHPDSIAYEPVTQRLFAFNGRSKDSTVIDAKTDAVLGTVALPGRPEAAVADSQGRIYVNIEDKSELSGIDARKMTVINTWSLAPCEGPSAIAMDTAHRRLFSGCDGKLMVVSDPDAGKVVTTAPIGDGVDQGGFDPGTGLVLMACGEGVLSVIHEDAPDHYTSLEDAATQKYARTMALDPKSHDVFLVTADLQITPAAAGATGRAARPKRTVLPNSFTVLVMHRQ